MLVKVILEIDKGPGTGTQYELLLQGYRAVGRAGGALVTEQFTTSGDRPLDPDDLACVEAHLARRSPPNREGKPDLRIGAFKRGRDVLLDDDKISKTHAMFFLDDLGPSVVDLFSTNGTHVNGKRIADADLADGDIVNLGKTRFVIRLTE